ncbi:cytochrome P450 [Xylariaceae sp. FL0255]|nr:cytochrome P450 [Xylariaceae sp. FL0255]
MGFFTQLFSFPNLTLAAAVESLVIIKVYGDSSPLPRLFETQSHLGTVATVFLANYAVFALVWGLLYPRLFSPLRNLRGPRALISLSHRSLITTDRPSGDLFLDVAKKYPGEEILNLSAFDLSVLVTKPRMLADLLVHKAYDFVKPPKVSGFLRHVLGDGLIVIEGDQHKFLRKNTMPAFSFRHIKNLYPMMWDKSDLMTSLLRQDVLGSGFKESVVEMGPWASRVTLDIIGVAGLGREFGTLKSGEDPLQEVYEQLLEPAPEKLAFALSCIVFGVPFVRFIPWRMNKVFAYLTSRLNEICMPMMQEKKQAIAEKGDDHFDILSLLLKSDNFTDSQLKDQLLTFLAAGHETTSSALTWASYLLAKHPELQKKLREEVCQALPEDINDKTELGGILEQLPYLNGIINETLRLYPTVPMTLREAICDTELAGQKIPKGVVIVLSMWQMNRSPELWGADAGEFRPERWITAGKPNTNGGAGSNYEFLTFLHGPRSCIGQGFARAEMRCLLASMIRTFEWDSAMDDRLVIPRGVITSKPANGMSLKLKPLKS